MYYTTERFNTNNASQNVKYKYKLVIRKEADTVTSETGIVGGSDFRIITSSVTFTPNAHNKTGRIMFKPAENAAVIREAVSIHTRKIFDSCRDKDCVDDLRVFPTLSSQAYIDNALSLRPRSAELLYIAVSVEPISFNRGYYTVDCTHFYRVTGETFPGGQTCTGLCVFDKRVMLFGSIARSKRP